MWVKIDDRFYQHPKIVSVGPLGMALQVAALCYCNQYLTDGFIPWAAAKGLISWEYLAPPDDNGRRLIMTVDVGCGMHGEQVCSERIIDLLLSAEIWIEVDGGYLIHDYGDFQKSKEEVTAITTARQEAGRRGGQAKRKQTPSKPQANEQANDVAKSKPVPVPVPVPDPDPVPNTDPEEKEETEHVRVDGFDQFWSAYPKKAAKKDAQKAWKQTAQIRPPIDAVLEAIRRQLEGRQWQQGIHPHAATWLRGERWNDEPEKATPQKLAKPDHGRPTNMRELT